MILHLALGVLQAGAGLVEHFCGRVGAPFKFVEVRAGVGQFGFQLAKLAVDRTFFDTHQVRQRLIACGFGGVKGLLGIA
jgi:hypothetical protein